MVILIPWFVESHESTASPIVRVFPLGMLIPPLAVSKPVTLKVPPTDTLLLALIVVAPVIAPLTLPVPSKFCPQIVRTVCSFVELATLLVK